MSPTAKVILAVLLLAPLGWKVYKWTEKPATESEKREERMRAIEAELADVNEKIMIHQNSAGRFGPSPGHVDHLYFKRMRLNEEWDALRTAASPPPKYGADHRHTFPVQANVNMPLSKECADCGKEMCCEMFKPATVQGRTVGCNLGAGHAGPHENTLLGTKEAGR